MSLRLRGLQFYSPGSSVHVTAPTEAYLYFFIFVFLVLLLIAYQIRFPFPLYFQRVSLQKENFQFEMLRFINSIELPNRVPADSIKNIP